MDNATQEPTVPEGPASLQKDNTEIPELNFNLQRKNSHGDDMPSLDNLNIPIIEVPNDTNTEVEQEAKEESTPNVNNSVEITEVTENTEISTETQTEPSQVEEISTIELPNTPEPTEIQKPTETLSEIAKVDIKDHCEVEEIQEFPISEDQITLEQIEEENSVQIITPDDPPIEEVETHEINFPQPEEANNSEPIPNPEEPNLTNVEYGVILNDNQTMNGVHEITKEELHMQDGLYESQAEIKVDQGSGFNPETMEDLVTIGNEVQEVTFLDTHPTVVTINEITEQPEEQVVILPEEQVILMESEEYDQPESIEVNVLETEKLTPEEMMAEEEEEETEDGDLKSQTEHSNIPCHVLGRSVDNPLVDPVRNGRVLLKPRLGVKIPYRNLTSQIVSKQEIAEEIMERSRLRQSSAEPPVGGDVFFAKKLTQRLAKKLVPPTNTKPRGSSRTVPSTSGSNKKPTKPEITVTNVKVIESPKEPTKIPDPSEKIIDNSDLIALLEGDDVPDWNIATKSTEPSSSTQTKPDTKRSSDWEREIALKQLKELPKHSRGGGGKSFSSNKYSPTKEDVKESKEIIKESPIVEEEKDDLNIEPRFSSNTVVKTYTRKRKPFPEELKAISSPIQKVTEEKSVQKPSSGGVIAQKSSPKSSSVSKSSSGVVEKNQKSPISSKKPVEDKKDKEKKLPQEKQEKKALVPDKKSSVGEKTRTSVAVEAATPPASTESKKKRPEAQATPSSTESKKSRSSVGVVAVATPPSTEPKRPRPSVGVAGEATPPSVEPKKALSPNTYISKSSRIVKRKKIWDPDEATPVAKVTMKPPKPTETPEKSPPKPKPVAPTILKPNNEKLPTKPAEKSVKSIAVLKPSNEKPILKKVKKIIVKKKKPKRLTEVDRLLMDEGAVNLLYSVKNTEELQNNRKKKKTLISLDRAQRELQNKTNEIKNDLQINSTKDSPISLRKKESTPKSSPVKDLAASVLHRKKSKDSMSGSVHSPPASPGFAYSQHADASRIIRRHSSSSFSSDDEEEEVEEEEVEEEVNQSGTEKPPEKKNKGEPQKKKAKLNHEKQPKGSIGVDKQLLNAEMTKNFNKPSDDPKYSEFQTFSVRKFDNLTQIILASTSANGQTTLSVKGLTELAEVLKVLQKDDSCRVVVISSSGSSFCEGIDYKDLASDDKTTRQSIADKYAAAVRIFLMTLSKFSKLLVAGVHGNAVGLGVTMLPLFDMVLASDTATFSTPYARLGCAAEGGVLLTLPHVMHNALASELFFASRKLTAAEALRLGLVTRTLWPDKFQEELISALKLIAGQSLQSMQAIKKQLRHHLLLNVEASLKSESSILIEHWTSNECQSNFSNYNLENK